MTLKEYSAAVSAMQKLVPPTYQEQLRKILRQKRSAVLHQMQLLGIDTADWDWVNASAGTAVSPARSSVNLTVRRWTRCR